MTALNPRVIIIVLDSVGIGALPDAADYGDAGTNTIAHVADAVGGLHMPNLAKIGLGNITKICGVESESSPIGCWGKMAEKSKGKDTTTGHWELAGVITETPFPTYPHGFPDDLIAEFESRIGRKTLGNVPASGTEIIKELGEDHIRTGFPIVYTSADSVFQIACHEDIVQVEQLYDMCRIAREMLKAPHNLQRVIARPFVGEPGAFTRTERRRDFALEPPSETLLDVVVGSGGEVIAIGKIEDIYAHRGITCSRHTGNNADAIEAIVAALASDFRDFECAADVSADHTRETSRCSETKCSPNPETRTLVMANLVDFDMLYGHRNDSAGYARALEEFDAALPRIVEAMRERDVLFITADHGCDPTNPSTDHTREYVPLLIYGKRCRAGVDLGSGDSFSDLACTAAGLLSVSHSFPGTSLAKLVLDTGLPFHI
jgi:phosphopentomutase